MDEDLLAVDPLRNAEAQSGRRYSVWLQLGENLVPTRRDVRLQRLPAAAHAQDRVCVEQNPCVVAVSAQGDFAEDAVYSCLFSSPGGGCDDAADPGRRGVRMRRRVRGWWWKGNFAEGELCRGWEGNFAEGGGGKLKDCVPVPGSHSCPEKMIPVP